jgi:hypothetical protein
LEVLCGLSRGDTLRDGYSSKLTPTVLLNQIVQDNQKEQASGFEGRFLLDPFFAWITPARGL